MKQSLVTFVLLLPSAIGFAPSSQILPCRQSPTSLQMSTTGTNNNNNDKLSVMSRRQIFSKIIGATTAATILSTQTVNALDMDAFINAELDNDTKNCDPKRDPKCEKQMSSDEATCKYGQGAVKAAACKKLKEAGKEVPKAAQGKSLGGAYAM